ncbi:MAG: nucleotidyl transferase AbiEii/AbiGii toxin family protein [Candidatus Nanoarchaeia archaeon]|nr:nucleotidyl transferase AbiEii/AbiGii toxin family protein [Candidatus Nanoarchaeia archaeon]
MENAKQIMTDPDTRRRRDKLLEGLLFYIARDPVLNKNLILQGGGALHFIYSSPRYSNDLDFVAPYFTENKKSLIRKLSEDLKNYQTFTFKNLKLDRNFLRTKYSIQDGNEVGSIDILEQTSNDFKTIEGAFSPLLVETPKEIYADKIISILGRMMKRGSIKGTDLFDLDFLIKMYEAPEMDLIVKKANNYGNIGFSKRTREQVLQFINENKNQGQIIANFKKSMTPDYFNEQKFDNLFFERVSDYLRSIQFD